MSVEGPTVRFGDGRVLHVLQIVADSIVNVMHKRDDRRGVRIQRRISHRRDDLVHFVALVLFIISQVVDILLGGIQAAVQSSHVVGQSGDRTGECLNGIVQTVDLLRQRLQISLRGHALQLLLNDLYLILERLDELDDGRRRISWAHVRDPGHISGKIKWSHITTPP